MKLLQELFATPDIGDQIVAPAEMVIGDVEGESRRAFVMGLPGSISFVSIHSELVIQGIFPKTWSTCYDRRSANSQIPPNEASYPAYRPTDRP